MTKSHFIALASEIRNRYNLDKNPTDKEKTTAQDRIDNISDRQLVYWEHPFDRVRFQKACFGKQ